MLEWQSFVALKLWIHTTEVCLRAKTPFFNTKFEQFKENFVQLYLNLHQLESRRHRSTRSLSTRIFQV